jgi:hypothetical protein
MLNKTTRSEPPFWQRKLVLILGSLLGATVLLFVVWAVTLFVDRARVDDCLDNGGRYDYDRGECEIEANHKVQEN